MGMPAIAREWTAEMVRALPEDGNRYEVVDGELFVTPAPILPHQLAVGELYQLIVAYLSEHGLGDVIFAPSDLEFDERTLVEPDLFVVPELKAPLPRYFENPRWLLLAIEVLSPSTARADRNVKRRLYQRAGIPEYWVVDLDARLIERWRRDDERPEILSKDIVWSASPAHPPLTVDLAKFFARVYRE